jgi:hypothetical protein
MNRWSGSDFGSAWGRQAPGFPKGLSARPGNPSRRRNARWSASDFGREAKARGLRNEAPERSLSLVCLSLYVRMLSFSLYTVYPLYVPVMRWFFLRGLYTYVHILRSMVNTAVVGVECKLLCVGCGNREVTHHVVEAVGAVASERCGWLFEIG